MLLKVMLLMLLMQLMLLHDATDEAGAVDDADVDHWTVSTWSDTARRHSVHQSCY